MESKHQNVIRILLWILVTAVAPLLQAQEPATSSPAAAEILRGQPGSRSPDAKEEKSQPHDPKKHEDDKGAAEASSTSASEDNQLATPPAAEEISETSNNKVKVLNASKPSDDRLWTFTLVDQSQLVGRIAKEVNGKLTIALVNGESRSVYRRDVVLQEPHYLKPVKVVRGEVWDENPNRTRHLWSPSAMPLRAGEGYLSQKQLLFTSYAVGLTDNIAVLLGSFVPGLLGGGDGFNVIGALKVADEIKPKVFAGAGAEVLVLPTVGVLGVGFASFTYGEPDAQISVNLGSPFMFDGDDQELGHGLISVSGMWRFRGDYGIVSENIFVPAVRVDEGWGILNFNALAIRSIGDRTSWDLGLVVVTGVPIPWFDYTWYLGD